MCAARQVRRLALAALLAIAACSEQTPPPAPGPQVDLVWPPAPLVPRIRFLQTLAVAADQGIQRGFFERVLDFLEGAEERRTSTPYGIYKDAEGRLYVVDTFHNAVQVFGLETAEHYWFPDEPFPGFENPIGVVASQDGRVFVSDSGSNLIHLFDDHGKHYVRSFGKGVLGRPTGMAFDAAAGQLLVADTLSSQIVVFDVAELRPLRFVGRQGAEEGAFNYPTSVAIAPDGRIYVTDAMNFRVQALDRGFGFVGSFGQVGDSPGDFSSPKGVAVDSEGHVYVVDALFDNVQIFDRDGRLLLAFGGPGAGPGQFWLPNEIFIDRNDRIYVSDAYNRRIQVFQYLKEGKAP